MLHPKIIIIMKITALNQYYFNFTRSPDVLECIIQGFSIVFYNLNFKEHESFVYNGIFYLAFPPL